MRPNRSKVRVDEGNKREFFKRRKGRIPIMFQIV